VALVPCPGCSSPNHSYNPEDPWSVGYAAGFHHQSAVGNTGRSVMQRRDYIRGVRDGSEASRCHLVQQELFSDMC